MREDFVGSIVGDRMRILLCIYCLKKLVEEPPVLCTPRMLLVLGFLTGDILLVGSLVVMHF